jgi:hypothetical protein
LASTCTNTIGNNKYIWIWQLDFKKLSFGGKGEVYSLSHMLLLPGVKKTKKKAVKK